MGEVRATVESRLTALQEGNEKKLEQMRATVDEKLHATLEQRLGESFKQVADRLEQVHKGLGEMQTLARDVGSLNRVLTNVKTRGIFGEVQLAGLLEQVFTPEQYATNVATVPGSAERVEFAIRLPGQRDDGAPLWLPIDAKFPREDYERLLDAQERADLPALEAAAKGIDTRLRLEARTHPRQVHRAAAHHRFRDPVRAHRGPVRRGAAPAGAGAGDAARAQGHARRADHAAGHADQPADGLSHAGAGTAQRRGLGGAGRGEDRVRQVRRRAGQARARSSKRPRTPSTRRRHAPTS